MHAHTLSREELITMPQVVFDFLILPGFRGHQAKPVAAGPDQAAGTIFTFSAAAARDDWDAYYPIVREMFESTTLVSGETLGIELPAILPAE